MAYKASSFLALLFITNVLLTTTYQAAAKRHIIPKNSNTNDKKEPQWFFHFDHIPSIGRPGLPPLFGAPQTPNIGVGTGGGAGPSGGSYVPGGDDTFVPNPGFEVPNPGSAGGIPAPITP